MNLIIEKMREALKTTDADLRKYLVYYMKECPSPECDHEDHQTKPRDARDWAAVANQAMWYNVMAEKQNRRVLMLMAQISTLISLNVGESTIEPLSLALVDVQLRHTALCSLVEAFFYFSTMGDWKKYDAREFNALVLEKFDEGVANKSMDKAATGPVEKQHVH